MDTLTIQDVEQMTLAAGENWGLAHIRRLLKLIGRIRGDLQYDPQALTWAVYLHDWGAFPKYAQAGVEHALRSRQVAETEILPRAFLSVQARAIALEAIEFHDYHDQRPVQSVEALLLREADFLDFLGAIGIAREFAKGPKDLAKSCAQIAARRKLIEGRFSLPAAREIAAQRLRRMDTFFEILQEESFGDL